MRERLLTAFFLLSVFVPVYFYINEMGFLVLMLLLGYGMLVESYAMSYGNKRALWGGLRYLFLLLIVWHILAPEVPPNLMEILPFTSILYFKYSFVIIGFATYLTIFQVIFLPFRILYPWLFSPGFFGKRSLNAFLVIDILAFISYMYGSFFIDKYFLFNVLLIVVGIDSFGFLVGKYFGKRHIVPTISPNKTLEGYIGSLVWTIVGGSILMIPKELSILALTLVLGVVYILAITGDLLVSYQKRLLDVKNSGTLLPGHGGLLDRFDSWIFVSAFVFYYLVF